MEAVRRGMDPAAVLAQDCFRRRCFTVFRLLAFLGCIVGIARSLDGASFRTRNFLVDAPTPQLAKAVGEAAEGFRRDLAVYWLGGELQPWPYPCPVRVISGPNLAAQGVTQYKQNPVRDFQMEVVGTPQRILDSVLPHEVTHTVLATHFGRPLPRWADEGICTTVEHSSERSKHEAKLREFLAARRGIAMNRLFLLTEYPDDILPMYAQGYSVCQFLIRQKGPQAFIRFLTDFMEYPSWTQNVRQHYGYESLRHLQNRWLAWVADGSGPVERYAAIPTLAPGDRGLAAETRIAAETRSATPVALASLEAPRRRNDLDAARPGSPRALSELPPTRLVQPATGGLRWNGEPANRSLQGRSLQGRRIDSANGPVERVGDGPIARVASLGSLPTVERIDQQDAGIKAAPGSRPQRDPWAADSWYARNRSEVEKHQASMIEIASMAPPSVKQAIQRTDTPYQTASPQHEGR